MKSYLSGQITGLDQDEFHRLFEHAEKLAARHNLDPVNPLKVKPCDNKHCGGDQKQADGSQLHAYGCYMKHDIKAMLECEAIVMLPNFEQSSGAQFELMVAIKCGLFVFYIDKNYERIIS